MLKNFEISQLIPFHSVNEISNWLIIIDFKGYNKCLVDWCINTDIVYFDSSGCQSIHYG